MHFDPAFYIGAVTRTVEMRQHEGQPVRAVRAERSYETDPDDLWDAMTSASRIPRWFTQVSGELRIGGRYQLQGNAGGEILRCEPPRLLAVTWVYDGQMSWLTVTLMPNGERGTHLALEHVVPVGEHWERFGSGAVGIGWDLALMGLSRHIETGAAVDPAEAMAWLGSPGGKECIRRSGDDWCRASIAGGLDAGDAQAAAERTRAFYSGEAAPET